MFTNTCYSHRNKFLQIPCILNFTRVTLQRQVSHSQLWPRVPYTMFFFEYSLSTLPHRALPLFSLVPVAEFIDPWLGETVTPAYRVVVPARQATWLVGQYDNLMPELTVSSSQGSMNSATALSPLTLIHHQYDSNIQRRHWLWPPSMLDCIIYDCDYAEGRDMAPHELPRPHHPHHHILLYQ